MDKKKKLMLFCVCISILNVILLGICAYMNEGIFIKIAFVIALISAIVVIISAFCDGKGN